MEASFLMWSWGEGEAGIQGFSFWELVLGMELQLTRALMAFFGGVGTGV
jgi:hypothetical protein